MKATRILALTLAMILAIGSLAGCGEKTVESSLPYAINEMDVDVIDELPDWTGEQLNLSVWWATGTNHRSIGKTQRVDKFQGEFKRVTGISLDEKTSFDNGGVSADSKIARVVAANTWPHVGMSIGGNILLELIDQDLVYDLTEIIPKYMPNFMSYINSSDELRYYWERGAIDGKFYTFSHLGNETFRFIDPEYKPENYKGLTSDPDSRGFIYVRDDILKAIHPETYTVKELQDIYMKEGKFTPEQITDYTIDSLEEFRTLLEDINDLGMTENGKKVWPIYTFDGMDNWSLFAVANFFAGTGYNSANSYFSYYDAKEDKIKNPVKENWYKEYVKFFNQLYRDGLASEEAFIDNKAAFDTKKANGEYAILYGLNAPPTQDALEAAGKDYAYRKVYVDIPTDTEKFGNASTIVISSYDTSMCFFKNMLTESQLEQILRALDFMYTDAGMKYAQWGPEKSGLYEVKEDGTFMYVDKEFENAMAYDGDESIIMDYGLRCFPPFDYFVGARADRLNKYHEEFVYRPIRDAERQPSNYVNAFKYNKVEPVEDLPYLDSLWHVYSYTTTVPGVGKMWEARQGVEDAFTHCLAAKSDEEFEKAWSELIAFEERNGYTDEAFEEYNKVFIEKNGGDISRLIKLG